MDLIEDKPETEKCDGALRRSTGCFNQQSLLDQPTQNVSQQSSNQSPSQLKSTPEKSTLSRKVNAGQQHQSQRSSNFGQPFDLGSCANVYGLPKSKSPINFSLFGPCIDQSQRWSNLRGNPSYSDFVLLLGCSNSSFFPRVDRNCPPSSSY